MEYDQDTIQSLLNELKEKEEIIKRLNKKQTLQHVNPAKNKEYDTFISKKQHYPQIEKLKSVIDDELNLLQIKLGDSNELNQELTILRDNIDELEVDLDELEDDLDFAQTQISIKDKIIDTLSHNQDAIKNNEGKCRGSSSQYLLDQCLDFVQDINQETNVIDTLQKETDSTVIQLKEMQQVTDFQSEIKQLLQENQNLKNIINEKNYDNQDIHDLKGNVSSIHNELNQGENDLNNVVESLQNGLSNTNQELKKIIQDIDSKKENVNVLVIEHGLNQTQIDTQLNESLRMLRASIDELEDDLDFAETQIQIKNEIIHRLSDDSTQFKQDKENEKSLTGESKENPISEKEIFSNLTSNVLLISDELNALQDNNQCTIQELQTRLSQSNNQITLQDINESSQHKMVQTQHETERNVEELNDIRKIIAKFVGLSGTKIVKKELLIVEHGINKIQIDSELNGSFASLRASMDELEDNLDFAQTQLQIKNEIMHRLSDDDPVQNSVKLTENKLVQTDINVKTHNIDKESIVDVQCSEQRQKLEKENETSFDREIVDDLRLSILFISDEINALQDGTQCIVQELQTRLSQQLPSNNRNRRIQDCNEQNNAMRLNTNKVQTQDVKQENVEDLTSSIFLIGDKLNELQDDTECTLQALQMRLSQQSPPVTENKHVEDSLNNQIKVNDIKDIIAEFVGGSNETQIDNKLNESYQHKIIQTEDIKQETKEIQVSTHSEHENVNDLKSYRSTVEPSEDISDISSQHMTLSQDAETLKTWNVLALQHGLSDHLYQTDEDETSEAETNEGKPTQVSNAFNPDDIQCTPQALQTRLPKQSPTITENKHIEDSLNNQIKIDDIRDIIAEFVVGSNESYQHKIVQTEAMKQDTNERRESIHCKHSSLNFSAMVKPVNATRNLFPGGSFI